MGRLASDGGTIPAVVTAGGRLSGEIATAAGTPIKALAPLSGRPLVTAMLDALQAAPGVGSISLVGPIPDLAPLATLYPSIRLVPEGETGPENVLRGLDAVAATGAAGHDYALVCTSDLPFVNSESIQWLLENAPEDADIVYPIVTREEYLDLFPASPNTWARIAGEYLTGGSVLLVRTAAIARNRALIERVFAARKSQWEMARLLGFAFLIRFLTRTLTVAQAEAQASRMTGCRCRALRGAPPQIACDIDTLADYQWAIAHQTVVRQTAPVDGVSEVREAV